MSASQRNIVTELLLLLCLLIITATTTTTTRLELELLEELQVGSSVSDLLSDSRLQVPAELQSALRYDVISGSFAEYFRVGETTGSGNGFESAGGQLIVNKTMDRDVICGHRAVCQGNINIAVMSKSFYHMLQVTVTLVDTNDNSPAFHHSTLTLDVSESSPAGTVLVLPAAEDPDIGVNGQVSYEFWCNCSGKMELRVVELEDGESTELRLVVVETLDRELEDVYVATVTAVDGGVTGPRTGQLDIVIKVLDANDNVPRFDRSLYEVSVREDTAAGTTILQVNAVDRDVGVNSEIRFSFSRHTVATYGALFSIDDVTGSVVLRQQVDYRADSNPLTLTVSAVDRGPAAVPVYAKLLITVIDVNNHDPVIRVQDNVLSVDENQSPGTVVGHLSVLDLDSGDGGLVDCQLVDGVEQFSLTLLQIDVGSALYRLVTVQTLDREDRPDHTATISCQDRGQPAMTSERAFTIQVSDTNDNSPMFVQPSYSVNVRENSSVITMPILRVWATDLDSGHNAQVHYTIEDLDAARFVTVDRRSGMISTVAPFDYEQINRLVFSVTASDLGRPVPRSATVPVTISVVDINDEAPRFTQSSYSFGTYENQAARTEIGTLTAADRDSPPFNRFTFSMSTSTPDQSAYFTVDPDTGTISTLRPLDRELQPVHHLVAMVTELAHPHSSSTVNVTVYVADRNDNAPLIHFPAAPDNDTVEVSIFSGSGHVFTRILATDADIGLNGRLRYAINSDNSDNNSVNNLFEVDSNNGLISVRHDLSSSVPSHVNKLSLQVTVRDSGEPEKTSSATLHIIVNRSLTALSDKISSKRASFFPGGNGELLGPDGKEGRTGIWERFLYKELVILLAVGTGLLVIVLLTAIVCIRRRQLLDSSADEPEIRDTTSGKSLVGSDVTAGGTSGPQTRLGGEPEFHIVRNIVSSRDRPSSEWKTNTLQQLRTTGGDKTISCDNSYSVLPTSCCDNVSRSATLQTFSKLSPVSVTAASTLQQPMRTTTPCCYSTLQQQQHRAVVVAGVNSAGCDVCDQCCCNSHNDKLTSCTLPPSLRHHRLQQQQLMATDTARQTGSEITRLLELLKNDARRDVTTACNGDVIAAADDVEDDVDDNVFGSQDDNNSVQFTDSGLGQDDTIPQRHYRVTSDVNRHAPMTSHHPPDVTTCGVTSYNI